MKAFSNTPETYIIIIPTGLYKHFPHANIIYVHNILQLYEKCKMWRYTRD